MGDHAQKMERTCVARIGVADLPVQALGVRKPAGAVVRQRSCERLFGTAPGTHGDISKAGSSSLAPVARPIAPRAEVYLTRAAIDPDRLVARQRAGRPIRRIACDVRGGMQDKRTAGIRCRRKRLLLISDDVRVAMMPWRLMAIGPSITA